MRSKPLAGSVSAKPHSLPTVFREACALASDWHIRHSAAEKHTGNCAFGNGDAVSFGAFTLHQPPHKPPAMNRPTSRLRSLIPTREQIMANRWLGWLRPFLAHPQLWRWSRRGVALGVALGIFFGLLIPIAQIPFSAAAAVLLRANVPAAAASTLVTNPVTFGPVYYAAYRLGSWIYGDTPQDEPPVHDDADHEISIWERIGKLGLPLITGLAIMATIFGLLSYFVISAVWYWRVKAKRRRMVRYYQTRDGRKNSDPQA